jgi:hypothetical protein
MEVMFRRKIIKSSMKKEIFLSLSFYANDMAPEKGSISGG